MDLPIQIRGSEDGDTHFILSSWLRSYKHYSSFAKEIPSDIFYNQHQKVIKDILANARVSILCNSEDKDQIFGYIVFEKQNDIGIIDFIYVKEIYRRLGFGQKLLQSVIAEITPNVYSHKTSFTKYLINHHNSGMRKLFYNPYIRRL